MHERNRAIIGSVMRNIVVAIVLAVLSVATADAQQRMRRPGTPGNEAPAPPAPPAIPDLKPDAAHPFVGVWEGQIRFESAEGTDTAPYILVIEFLNGAYTGYSVIGNPGGLVEHVADSVSGTTLHWEVKNRGQGLLVWDAAFADARTIVGHMTSRDVGLPAGFVEPKVTVRLQRRAAGR